MQIPNHFSRFFLPGLILGALILTPGCRSYQAGSGGELPFRTIYLRPASNNSFAPQAQAAVSSQVRQAFIRHSRVTVVANEDEADAVLLIMLTDYNRETASRQSEDIIRARDFDLTLTCAVSLYDANAGKFLFRNREIDDTANAFVDNPLVDDATDTQGFLQAEYQAMPRLARDLSRKIADEVLSAW